MLLIDTVPATGLQDAYPTYTVEAVSLATGETSWSTQIEDWVRPADRSASGDAFEVTETPSGSAPGKLSVLVSLNGSTALDSDTGSVLWHIANTYTTPNAGSYVTGGIVESTAPDGGVARDLGVDRAGIDARTGAVKWTQKYPTFMDGASGTTDAVYGHVEIYYFHGGFMKWDVLTGKIIAAAAFPSSWQGVTVTEDTVIASTSDGFSAFSMTDLSHPRWSVPADNGSSVVVAGTKHLLVNAQSGFVLVALADGTLSDPIAVEFSSTSLGPVTLVDGMALASSEAPVLEVDEPIGAR